MRPNNSCSVKGFKQGDLKLTFKAEDHKLDVFYQTSDDISSKTKTTCFESLIMKELGMRGYLGFTAMNGRTMDHNDYDIKTIDIYNLKKDKYQRGWDAKYQEYLQMRDVARQAADLIE